MPFSFKGWLSVLKGMVLCTSWHGLLSFNMVFHLNSAIDPLKIILTVETKYNGSELWTPKAWFLDQKKEHQKHDFLTRDRNSRNMISWQEARIPEVYFLDQKHGATRGNIIGSKATVRGQSRMTRGRLPKALTLSEHWLFFSKVDFSPEVSTFFNVDFIRVLTFTKGT